MDNFLYILGLTLGLSFLGYFCWKWGVVKGMVIFYTLLFGGYALDCYNLLWTAWVLLALWIAYKVFDYVCTSIGRQVNDAVVDVIRQSRK